MRRTIVLAAMLTEFAFGTRAALAEVVAIGARNDNTLYQSTTGGLSNGSGQHFFVGRTAQGSNASIRRGLIAFDIVGNIPEGSTINGVELTLFMSKTPAGAKMIRLHRALVEWGEGTSDDSGAEGNGTGATAGDATWLHTFFNTDFWATPGGDFMATASGSQSVGSPGFYTWSSTPQMVANVQAWLDTPATNFGWLLVGDESSIRTAKRFDSRENTNASRRPELTVDFTFVAPPGACCDDTTGVCLQDVVESECTGFGQRYGGDGSDCETLDPAVRTARRCVL